MITRHGHLTDLALEDWLDGALEPTDQATVTAHLSDCADCARRVAGAQADDALPLPPRRTVPANRPWPLWGAALVAVAAMVAVMALPPADDGIRVKGAGLSLDVVAEGGAGQRRLAPGAVVHPGERLGFRVRSDRPGHLLVVNIDGSGTLTPCVGSGASAPVAASADWVTLPGAVRLDAQPGEERILAVRCDQAFTVDDLRAAGGRAPEGCVVTTIPLTKDAP